MNSTGHSNVSATFIILRRVSESWSWRVNIVKEEHVSVLGEFMQNAAHCALSIVLVGSQAEGGALDNSDIDLIIIAQDERDAEEARRLENWLNKPHDRPVLDCKVYTQKEFMAAKGGRENRFLWTSLRNGRVLSGRDITREVKLLPQSVVDDAWSSVKNVEESRDSLSAMVKFTGSCYYMFDALTTVYFIEKHVLHSIDARTRKADFIRTLLGDQFEKARERYYWVARHVETKTGAGVLRVSGSIDRRYGKKEYTALLHACNDVLDYVTAGLRRIMDWAESPSDSSSFKIRGGAE